MSLVRQVGDPVDAGSPATYIDERVPLGCLSDNPVGISVPTTHLYKNEAQGKQNA